MIVSVDSIMSRCVVQPTAPSDEDAAAAALVAQLKVQTAPTGQSAVAEEYQNLVRSQAAYDPETGASQTSHAQTSEMCSPGNRTESGTLCTEWKCALTRCGSITKAGFSSKLLLG
jgi:hypothetical protein